jgi:Zn-dependent metalloprotease
MKRFSLNTVSSLWIFVILIASCAFTNKAIEQEKTINTEFKPPSQDFINQLYERNGCSEGKSDHLTHCYYFTDVDYGNYEPISYENIFTKYRSLLDFGKEDEIRFIRKQHIKAFEKLGRKERYLTTYHQYYKGYPVYDKHAIQGKIEIDSINGKITRVRANVLANLDMDVTIKITEKEAQNKAIAAVKLKEGANFQWKYYNEVDKELYKPKGKLIVLNYELAYEFPVNTYFNGLPQTYVVYVSAENGRVIRKREPRNNIFASENTIVENNCNPVFISGNETEAEYSLDNPMLTGVNNEFLEFDLDIASLINNEEFFGGEVFVEYNALTFGTNLASSGILTISKGTVITAPNYTITVMDFSPDMLKISVTSTSNNPGNLYTITNQAEEFAHIKIDITNIAGNTGIEFDEPQMQGLTEYYDANVGGGEPVDLVKATDELDIDVSGVFNGSATCDFCDGNTLGQTTCPNLSNSCPSNSYTLISTTVPTTYHGCQIIHTDSCSNVIKLRSIRPNENIRIIDPHFNPLLPPMLDTLQWGVGDTIILDDLQKSEANAMFSIQTSVQYFANKLAANSYDNMGSIVDVHMHLQSNGGAWNSFNNKMDLGAGTGGICGPIVSLDIVGHEYTHAVLENYIDFNQDTLTTPEMRFWTMALHESLADIFSVLIRYSKFGIKEWDIGLAACQNNHSQLPRFVNAPNNSKVKQATYYQDTNHDWSTDYTKIYNRGGVISYWFYLLSEGGTGVKNHNVNGIGMPATELVIIKALELAYLDTTKTQFSFEDFRDLTLAGVIDFYGACSTEHQSVVEAWIAVGLLDCDDLAVNLEVIANAAPCLPTLRANVENGTGCYTYAWYEDIGGNWQVLTGQNGNMISAPCNKAYKVEVTDNLLSNCLVNDDVFVTATSTKRIEDLKIDFDIRPTLVENRVFFDLEVSETSNVTIKIYDQLGRLIATPKNQERYFVGSHMVEYNTSHLANGLYFVSLETSRGKVTKKFVKM